MPRSGPCWVSPAQTRLLAMGVTFDLGGVLAAPRGPVGGGIAADVSAWPVSATADRGLEAGVADYTSWCAEGNL